MLNPSAQPGCPRWVTGCSFPLPGACLVSVASSQRFEQDAVQEGVWAAAATPEQEGRGGEPSQPALPSVPKPSSKPPWLFSFSISRLAGFLGLQAEESEMPLKSSFGAWDKQRWIFSPSPLCFSRGSEKLWKHRAWRSSKLNGTRPWGWTGDLQTSRMEMWLSLSSGASVFVKTDRLFSHKHQMLLGTYDYMWCLQYLLSIIAPLPSPITWWWSWISVLLSAACLSAEDVLLFLKCVHCYIKPSCEDNLVFSSVFGGTRP